MMKYWLLLMVCVVMACYSNAQSPLVRHRYLNESGTSVKVNSLALDENGLLWLGAENGLYTFDGHNFELVSDSIRDDITAINCHNKTVVYGTGKGLVFQYAQSRTTKLLKTASPISCIVRQKSKLIIGTLGDGLFTMQSDKINHWTAADILPDDYVYKIIPHAGKLYLATDLGVFVAPWGSDKVESFTKLPFNNDIARTIAITSPDQYHLGFMVAGFQEAGIAIYSEYPDMPPKSWPINGQINDIVSLRNGLTWIVTSDGALCEISNFKTLQPLVETGKKVNQMIADRSGNVWLATNEGLTQLTQPRLQQLPLTDYKLAKITALAANDFGIWYSQEATLMYADRKGKQSKIFTAPDLITCIYKDAQDGLWIGTSGKGVIYRDALGAITSFPKSPQLSNNHILSITGYEGKIWLSALNGVEEITVIEGSKVVDIHHHSKQEGIGSDYVYHMFADSKKRIWMGTDGAGIAVFENGKFRHWNEALGSKHTVFYSVAEDTYGNIWAGTLEHGVYKFDGKNWEHFGKEEGLQDETILSIAAGQNGQVVFVTGKGVDAWYPRDKLFRHINRRSGFGIDSTSDVLNAITYSNGSVVVPTQNSFLLLNNGDSTVTIRPSVNLSAILPLPKKSGKQQYAYDDNYFSFRFSGVNYAHAERLFYRYRLVGFNNNWTATTDELASYPKLPPGDYIFEVQASLNRRFNHPATDRFSFTIQAPFWKQYWFIGLSLLAIGGFIYIVLQLRIQAVRKTARLKQERLTFEYEYLKSQVNPHFLFNSLNTLITLIEENPSAAVNYTEQLSDLYRDALSKHDDDLILLSEEWKVLERYLYIQQNRFGDALQLNAHVSEEIKTTRRVVPLALQLLVENAVKHNVVSASNPLIISVDVLNDQLVIKNQIRQKITPEKGSGLGLQHILKRYALVTARPVRIEETAHEFIVTLPLL